MTLLRSDTEELLRHSVKLLLFRWIPRKMAGESSSDSDLRSSRLTEPLEESFVRFRRGEFDPTVDAKLKQKGREVLERYNPNNIKKYRINTHSIFWMVASIALFYYTDFYLAVKINPRVKWTWLCIGLAFLSITVSIGLFCIIWCHYLKGIPDYERKYPYIIPVATVSFFVGITSSCVALWPLWGWFTPLILLTFVMGLIFASSILPI